ncbi:hypothetical protein RvY_09375-2 [Ramazzottius varieornatus]|uniref:Protein phosphatase 1 regulatory subunit 12B n=1 Tax=Ramazzottius varieornatus TaxID=947166 RepID=A0A1D1VEN1_RAMVA|nr:hypothetical protein RvY_09375-2 [Ramazzottius varieornatus]
MSPADENNADSQPRSATAVVKRADQLKRWLESETNKEQLKPKDKKQRVVFDQRVCFLAACAAGDFDEISKLLSRGLVDINVSQEDGMTALHQACIDDRLDMVKFLVERHADINRGDNEGWTPLHATASCGYLDIARFLIDHGARVDIVNNDGELPIDIADTDEMENLLQTEIYKQGIDISLARSEEEQIMMKDVKSWYEGNSMREQVHPKTGATPLHVASAKGYLEVMRMLLELGVDINARDVDGWTPLHAAAHWGQRESCKTLVENGCDMDAKTSMGQTILDVCDPELINFLEDLQKRQPTLVKEKSAQESQQRRQPIKRRISANKNVAADRTAEAKAREAAFERAQMEKHPSPLTEHNPSMEATRPAQVPTSATAQSPYAVTRPQPQPRANIQEEVKPVSTVPTKPISFLQPSPTVEQQPRVPSPTTSAPQSKAPEKPISFLPPGDSKPISFLQPREPAPVPSPSISPTSTPTVPEKPKEAAPPAQKVSPISFLNRTEPPPTTQPAWIQKPVAPAPVSTPLSVAATAPVPKENPTTPKVSPTPSASVKATLPNLPSFDYIDETTPQQSPSADSTRTVEARSKRPSIPSANTFFGAAAPESPSAGGDSKEANVTVRRSFQPPNRDEESEAQRKAHAKRVRETRRSTQGVSAEDLKAADAQTKQFSISSSTSAQPSSPPSHDESEKENEAKKGPARISQSASTSAESLPTRASTNPVLNVESVNLTLPARKTKTEEEADERKEKGDRRRVRKRRSTGVVNMDMDEEEGSASGTDFIGPQAEPSQPTSGLSNGQKTNGLSVSEKCSSA